MAYQGIDSWHAIYSPMLRLLSGDPDPIDFDEDWDEEGELSPWGEEAAADLEQKQQIEIERPELPEVKRNNPSFDIMLPNERDPGLAGADRNAAMKGVDPGKRGGQGQLFSLARTFLGTPYVFGASGPTAFDCSGFVKYLYGRVYGVDLPHSAAQQSSMTTKVSREEMQPGDLIFYSYGRLGKGAIDHVEVYMGRNQQIGTSNPGEDLDIDDIDWDNVSVIGRVPGAGGAAAAPDPRSGPVKTKTVRRKVEGGDLRTPEDMLLGDSGLVTGLAEVLAGDTFETMRRVKTPKFRGASGGIKRQLYRGFVDAGREDLARMVSTDDFDTWVNAESGWRVDVASPANNNGLANDGLFQIWRGHEYNSRGQVGRMSPYEQAQIVARYFDLTPEDIRRYAEEIRGGRYEGWG